uniref:CMGC/RCK/MAK protein kinase n=1 Tax=Kwoniella bestiolae CBS 10118 TaxID=1296100 RepID=A0A1B9GBH8_9TREE|nr:CMGC/RCK/MAK protein kinase [Kwoniella bestiolae CBS 10118]OCF28361.1 CMGC/RCK/MAK protein kinase [Kwoniella bestiolae CBS 10118]
MSTAFVPVALAPTIHYSDKYTHHPHSHTHSAYPSPEGEDRYRSPPPNVYLHTPDSPQAQPHQSSSSSTNMYQQPDHHQGYNHQQQQQQPQPQPQPQPQRQQQPDWHTQVAGPSTRRRQSPSSSSHPSPIAVNDYRSTSREPGHKENRMVVDGEEDDGRIGTEDPRGERKYTELKCLGDGSFGTVWLCDWHSPVKSDIILSAMQCGAGARPEWAGKRLVALKRMKRVWEGGWKQARTLGELVSLSKIPPHPAIIPLYDAFISPKSRELYFVFECMEGNLYQLTKSRRGRPLAAGLIASCFHQISAGLHHIHQYGYFHRDMKPENLLVTTTGLTDYLSASTLAQINNSRIEGSGVLPPTDDQLKYEKDVRVIVKLADFGLARATNSKPPYTEYVSTRWYRAPEVLLRSTDYGPPVDMWALGTILAEMVNLKPLFPGVSEIDQVYRITETMGEPSGEYGVDERGQIIGGGPWNSGIKLAKNVGFSFPKRQPVWFRGLFGENVPQSLVDCIHDLLRYNPKYRLTSAQCIDHAYFHETLPHLQQTPPLPHIPFSQGQPQPGALRNLPAEIAQAPPRQVPPSHSHTPHEARPAFANGDMRTLPPPLGTPDSASPAGSRFFPPAQMHGHNQDARTYSSASALVHQLRELDLPTDDLASYGNRPAPSPGLAQTQQIDPRARSQQWTSDVAMSTHRSPPPQSTVYDGSVYEGSHTALNSNPSFNNYSSTSIPEPSARLPYDQLKPHVAAYVQQQQQQRYAEESPRQASTSQISLAPPIEPTVGAARVDKLAVSGKKKKWGLSSVFGGAADKGSTVDLTPVAEPNYSGSSLKRTQSGNRPQDRMVVQPPTILDPKKAKKEAEKAAKEAEKAKREAAAALQKERARAVMQKRNQLIAAQNQSQNKAELEFASSNVNESGTSSKSRQQQHPSTSSNYISPSSTSLAPGHNPSMSNLRNYPNVPASSSMTSVRSHESAHSAMSNRSGLSAAALKAYDDVHGEGRHKARRRDDDDDHSMSSFGQGQYSRSVLTVGTMNTVDSDPGPRRAREHWPDPLRQRETKRAPSISSFKQQHGPTSRSTASLESQLAHDFKVRANVGAAPSSASLGRLGQGRSSLSLHGQMEGLGHPLLSSINGSAPTSPYGHPKAVAVSHGIGMGRQSISNASGQGAGTVLPSISSFDGHQGNINPMFIVVSVVLPLQNLGER